MVCLFSIVRRVFKFEFYPDVYFSPLLPSSPRYEASPEEGNGGGAGEQVVVYTCWDMVGAFYPNVHEPLETAEDPIDMVKMIL